MKLTTENLGEFFDVRTELLDGDGKMKKVKSRAVLQRIGSFTYPDGDEQDAYTFFMPGLGLYTTTDSKEFERSNKQL